MSRTEHSRSTSMMGLISLLSLLVSPSLDGNEIFQWVDEKGRKHYSDMPRNNLYTGKQAEVTPFIPLPQDNRPAMDKLPLLEGRWQQTETSPSLDEMANLLATLWKLPENKRPALEEKTSILTIKQPRVIIENKPNGSAVRDNTDSEPGASQNFSAKLEFYNNQPLDIGGFWNFEQGLNPFILAFMEQVSMSDDDITGSEQARFDIQGNRLMVTVKLPEKLQVTRLQIIYEKLDDELKIKD